MDAGREARRSDNPSTLIPAVGPSTKATIVPAFGRPILLGSGGGLGGARRLRATVGLGGGAGRGRRVGLGGGAGRGRRIGLGGGAGRGHDGSGSAAGAGSGSAAGRAPGRQRQRRRVEAMRRSAAIAVALAVAWSGLTGWSGVARAGDDGAPTPPQTLKQKPVRHASTSRSSWARPSRSTCRSAIRTASSVKLGDYFQDEKPAILTFNYSNCPMLCSVMLNGLVTAMAKIQFQPGQQFKIITIDLEPTETPAKAEKFRKRYIDALPDDKGEAARKGGWTFLVAPGPATTARSARPPLRSACTTTTSRTAPSGPTRRR